MWSNGARVDGNTDIVRSRNSGIDDGAEGARAREKERRAEEERAKEVPSDSDSAALAKAVV